MNVLLKKLLAYAGLFALLISVAGCGNTKYEYEYEKDGKTRKFKKTTHSVDAAGNDVKSETKVKVTPSETDKEVTIRY